MLTPVGVTLSGRRLVPRLRACGRRPWLPTRCGREQEEDPMHPTPSPLDPVRTSGTARLTGLGATGLLLLALLAPAAPASAAAIVEFAVPTAASAPRFITAGPDGNLWFAEF